jgi:hypothetical protein
MLWPNLVLALCESYWSPRLTVVPFPHHRLIMSRWIGSILMIAGLAAGSRPSVGLESTCGHSCLASQLGPQLSEPVGITVSPPVSITPTVYGVATVTSLASWRDYNSRQLAKKIEDVQLPALMAMPRPPQVSLPLDVWTRVNVTSAGLTTQQAAHVTAGVDYRFSQAVVGGISGLLAGPDDARLALAPEPQDRLAAYAKFTVSPVLSIEAKGTWSTPSVPTDAPPSTDDERAGIAISPRLAHRFALDGGQHIEPFVVMRGQLNPGDLDEGLFSPSAAAGVVIQEPTQYSLSLSTSIEGFEPGEDRVPNTARVQLKIPMP